MSRYLPDTWLDAVQLPFAMVQFAGNVYVEPIAPDLRPAAFELLSIVALALLLVRLVYNALSNKQNCLSAIEMPRAGYALVTAALLALAAWIISSANGRYGLLPITLSPLAVITLLIFITRSKSIQLLVISVLLAGQAVFLLSADPDDTWSKLTRYRWDESYADRLPANVIAPWRHVAETEFVLVVTNQTLTGMSTLYQVFGPKAHYMSLAYLDRFPHDSPERIRANQLIKAADQVYLSRAVTSTDTTENRGNSLEIKNPVNELTGLSMKRFGLAPDNSACMRLPERMGTHLQICQLTKTSVETERPEERLPKKPLAALSKLALVCPKIFKDMRVPINDEIGGITTSVQDGKYYLIIDGNLDFYMRHRGDHEDKLVIRGDEGRFDITACSAIINAGKQYWR